MKVDIWMPLYVADYLADTSRLTTEQHGAYLLLLMDYWRNGPPPDDNMVLSQITRMTPDAWSIAQASLRQYFKIEDGLWKHDRVERELLAAKDKKERQTARARAGAAKRWSKEDATSNATSIPSSNAQAMHMQCPSPSPSHIKKPIDRRTKATQLPEGFQPDETGVKYAEERCIDFNEELESFKQFHEAKGSTYVNWQAAWRTWVGNAVKFGRAKPKKEVPWARAI
jgi:uncharacterized protein YdaU (DUF1376 family)